MRTPTFATLTIVIACLFSVGCPRAWRPLGQPVRSWHLHRHVVGPFTAHKRMNDGLLLGTRRGYIVRFPSEADQGKVAVANVAQGQEVLGVDGRGSFLAAHFYDARRGQHCACSVDTLDFLPKIRVYHGTRILAAAYSRVSSEGGMVSLSIDGHLQVARLSTGEIIREGFLQDMEGLPSPVTSPTCMCVDSEGLLAVGMHDGRICFVDLGKWRVLGSVKGSETPRAMDMARGDNRHTFHVTWTTQVGTLVRGRFAYTKPKRAQRPNPNTIKLTHVTATRVCDAPLVYLSVAKNNATVVQTDEGRTFFQPSPKTTTHETFLEMAATGCIVCPLNWNQQFLWYSHGLNVRLVAMDGNHVAGACDQQPCDVPCDS